MPSRHPLPSSVILAAIATSFRALRGEMRDLRDRIDAQGREIGQLRERMAHRP